MMFEKFIGKKVIITTDDDYNYRGKIISVDEKTITFENHLGLTAISIKNIISLKEDKDGK